VIEVSEKLEIVEICPGEAYFTRVLISDREDIKRLKRAMSALNRTGIETLGRLDFTIDENVHQIAIQFMEGDFFRESYIVINGIIVAFLKGEVLTGDYREVKRIIKEYLAKGQRVDEEEYADVQRINLSQLSSLYILLLDQSMSENGY